jgi:tetratricopeptide (TPR) repeat protein
MKKADRKARKKKPQKTDEKKDKSAWFILLVLVAVPLVLYWQATGFDLVWDDIDLHLISNPHLIPASSDNLLHFWNAPYEGLYIPVAYNGWTLLNAWFSSKPHDPFPYHLANILLHTLNGLLVFALLRLFIRNPWAAMAGALVFLVHPIQVESVAWVSEFRGLLAAAFGFSALLIYSRGLSARYGEPGPKWPGAVSTLLFLLALLSKPSVAVLPFLAALMEYYLHRPTLKQLCSRSWLWLWLVFSGAIAVVTSSVQESIQTYPFWAKPLIWLDAVSFYLYKLLFPFSLAASYARTPEHVMGQWWFYVAWMIPVGVGFCLWRFRKKAPLLLLAALVFLLGFLPVSGLKEFNFQAWSTVADRYLYLSMPGVALGFAYAATRMTRQWQWGIMAGVILLLGGRSYFVQVPVWENPLKLWSHCIEITPGSPQAHNNRGISYTKKREFAKAIADFSKALALNPESDNAYSGRGFAYGKMKDYDKAISDFDKALALNPNNVKAYNNRGLVYDNNKEYAKAIADFSKAISLNPEFAEACNNRGLVYDNNKEYAKAIADFSKAISLNPEFAEAHNNRGVAYAHKQEPDRAISDFSKALALNPDYSEAYNNRAIAYFVKTEYHKALADLKRARDLGFTVNPRFLQELIRKASE